MKLKISIGAIFCILNTLAVSSQKSNVDFIELHSLDSIPVKEIGVSWGVPWAKGLVKKSQIFELLTKEGKALPLQAWPMAFWPDGSLKWSGFATVLDSTCKTSFILKEGKSKAQTALTATEIGNFYTINTGALQCYIAKNGTNFIDSIVIEGRKIACNGRLKCITEDRSAFENDRILKYEYFKSKIGNVTLEKKGPVVSVVKISGVHKSESGNREWLPFYVRLYFYTGQLTIRMVHTFIFDGNEHTDFIKGLGIEFDIPFREELQNRHIRFSGEGKGLWAEPIQPLKGRDGRAVTLQGKDVYLDQIAGKPVPDYAEVRQQAKNLLDKWVVWNDFKLVQPNADGFTIVKRTNAESCWLPSGAGKQASGLVFAGDISGGLAVGLKKFWQSYPASLEVANASGKTAELKIWLWSPDAEAMDLRHYDTIAHGLNEVYEDVQPGFSTPNGIARTSELTLFVTPGIPTKEETSNMAFIANNPPLLVCTPKYLHDVKAFGIWSLPDSSTSFKKALENQLDGSIAYYQKSIEQFKWYGFWDYGDVMHSYDPVRHVWRYDLGGMAWDNSELGTDMWLWYSFLRTGRKDIFRMAEAMTRHTSEVDCYHLGRFAGLGSRHNVRHWGCGAKEARISQAAYRRFYYYLTTDERTGDVMHEVVNSDYKAAEYDPMRLASPIKEGEKKYPGRVRGGPDWLAFVGNWMTEWERTGDTKWRDKIYTGMDCILKMPYWFRSGENLLFGYDPSNGKLFQLTKGPADYNLATIMGGAEVIFELNEFIDHPGWQKAWLQYCRLTSAPADTLIKDQKNNNEGSDGSYARPDRLAAYAYMKSGNKAFAQKALSRLTWRGTSTISTNKIIGPNVLNPIDESPRVGTNGTAQSSLIAIEILEMCKDQLPDTMPPAREFTRPREFQRPEPQKSQDND